jgi:hypothetical protein
MKALLAACFALITLTGCTQTVTFDEMADGKCSDGQGRLVQDHISGQINAFSSEEWESAYSFASPGFQEAVSLEQFIYVIRSQYQMLIDNECVEFGSCTIASESIAQEVSVTSRRENFQLTYDLSYGQGKLGIDSASLTLSEPQINT